MTEEEKKIQQAEQRAEAQISGEGSGAEGGGETPSPTQREQYMNAYKADYPDMDTENEDAFYTQANKNYAELKSARQNQENLNNSLKDYPELNDMIVLASRGENPWVWIAENLGMDVRNMADDPEFAEALTTALEKFRQAEADKTAQAEANDAEMRQKEEEVTQNIQQSAQLLSDIQQEKGLTDEECDAIFTDFFQNVIEDGRFGIVSRDTWLGFINSRNYDSDMEAARKDAATKALNEKFQNNLHKTPEGMPPSIQGQGADGKGGRSGGFFSGVS